MRVSAIVVSVMLLFLLTNLAFVTWMTFYSESKMIRLLLLSMLVLVFVLNVMAVFQWWQPIQVVRKTTAEESAKAERETVTK